MGCVLCGDTGLRNGGIICNCDAVKKMKPKIKLVGIPYQYQNVTFDKDFLNPALPAEYGEFMDRFYFDIITNIGTYQKNHLICMKANSGKNIWSYTLITALYSKGYSIPQLRDIYEVQSILSGSNFEEVENYSMSRCVIIKIPRHIQPWLFDIMSMLLERRVRNNGFTIFMYSGTFDELKESDKYNRLRNMTGNGSYNTILVKSF